MWISMLSFLIRMFRCCRGEASHNVTFRVWHFAFGFNLQKPASVRSHTRAAIIARSRRGTRIVWLKTS